MATNIIVEYEKFKNEIEKFEDNVKRLRIELIKHNIMKEVKKLSNEKKYSELKQKLSEFSKKYISEDIYEEAKKVDDIIIMFSLKFSEKLKKIIENIKKEERENEKNYGDYEKLKNLLKSNDEVKNNKIEKNRNRRKIAQECLEILKKTYENTSKSFQEKKDLSNTIEENIKAKEFINFLDISILYFSSTNLNLPKESEEEKKKTFVYRVSEWFDDKAKKLGIKVDSMQTPGMMALMQTIIAGVITGTIFGNFYSIFGIIKAILISLSIALVFELIMSKIFLFISELIKKKSEEGKNKEEKENNSCIESISTIYRHCDQLIPFCKKIEKNENLIQENEGGEDGDSIQENVEIEI